VGARAEPRVESQAWWRILVTEEKKQQTLADFTQTIYKMGVEMAEQGKYDEAIGILSNVHVTLPMMTAVQLQIGRCHWEMHRWELARQHFEIATQLEPHNDDAGWTVGLLALQMGDFKKGWEGYERRWGSKSFKSPKLHTKHPQWERGKGLRRPIIWCEQGIGDQILYGSLIEALAREVDEVTVMIDLRVANLFQRACRAKNVKFLSHNSRVKMSEHDSHIPIASLGKYFINSVRDIQPSVSSAYIKADPERVAMLRKEYNLHEEDFVVGLCWTSTAPVIGQHKSVPLEAFRPILDKPYLKFINLQYGDAQKEGEGFHPSLITTHIDTFLDLENVAALMEICSVIISPSCATVHLAGAMGKDVLLLDANKLWYWNNKVGNESMWYSGIKIFQRENMNAPWDLQMQQVKEELEMILGERERKRQTFVFFHVGKDISYPQKMVKSLLRHNPDANVIMCTDTKTPDVMGVTDRFEIDVDPNEILYGRIKSYARLCIEEPALFLDNDMIIQSEIDVEEMLGGTEVAFCRRTFNRDDGFNINMRGFTFEEHDGKTMDQVFPYVACAVAVRDTKIWQEILNIYDTLHPKYRGWYGDQEAMRIYGEKYGAAEFPESVYGCLPEHKTDEAKILHFKGPSRKKQFEGM
jgi:hypothetical protein